MLAKAFKAERASWRAVIQLNVVRSIRLILEAMMDYQNAQNPLPIPLSMSPLSRAPSASATSRVHHASPTQLRLTPDHLKLRLRLLPLLQIEEVLIRKLTPAGSLEYEATHLAQITNIPNAARHKEKELAVNSQFAWKGLFGKSMTGPSRMSFDDGDGIDWNDPDVSSLSAMLQG